MAIDLKLTAQEKKQISQFTKPHSTPKVVHPQEKVGAKIAKDFNPRKG